MIDHSNALLESRVYSMLARLDLAHWNHVFALIALNFSGLEEVADVGCSTLQQLFGVIQRAEGLPREWRDRALFDGIASLSVWQHHAENESGRWHPLRESLHDFRARGQRNIFWFDERPHPCASDVAEWLRRTMPRVI